MEAGDPGGSRRGACPLRRFELYLGFRRGRQPPSQSVPLRIVLATSSARSAQRRRLLIALGLAGIAFVVEAIAAVVANSLALLAESFHRLIDVVALALALLP